MWSVVCVEDESVGISGMQRLSQLHQTWRCKSNTVCRKFVITIKKGLKKLASPRVFSNNRNNFCLQRVVTCWPFKKFHEMMDWGWNQCNKSHYKVVLRNLATAVTFFLSSYVWTKDNIRSVWPGQRRKRTKQSFFRWKQFPASHSWIKEREWEHRIQVLWSPTQSSCSQWWFGVPCHLLLLSHCVFWSPESPQPLNRKLKSP